MTKQFKLLILNLIQLLFLLPTTNAFAHNLSYNPLLISSQFKSKILDVSIHDDFRDREIPIRVYLPSKKSPVPVILFSHGLGGSRRGNTYLGLHWSARGYIAIFLQHPGSDDSVWKNVPINRRLKTMKKAASIQNFLLRVKDIPIVIDQLKRWNISKKHPLSGRMDVEHIGMSGHSFGAVTTQAVSGQTNRKGKQAFTDRRIKAAIVFSPSSPRRVKNPERFFSKVKIPWLLITGTKDLFPIGNATIKSRQAVFPALPLGDKYELILHEAEHSAFTDRALPGDKIQRNPNHHKVILAISTAFWDSWLQNNLAAKVWLNGNGPHSILEKHDSWKKK